MKRLLPISACLLETRSKLPHFSYHFQNSSKQDHEKTPERIPRLGKVQRYRPNHQEFPSSATAYILFATCSSCCVTNVFANPKPCCANWFPGLLECFSTTLRVSKTHKNRKISGIATCFAGAASRKGLSTNDATQSTHGAEARARQSEDGFLKAPGTGINAVDRTLTYADVTKSERLDTGLT